LDDWTVFNHPVTPIRRADNRERARHPFHPQGIMRNQAGDLFNLPSVLLCCGSDQAGKTGWVRNREFCKNFPIQRDTGYFEAMHEFTVGQIIHPRTRINSGDPEAAKIPFFDLAIPVGIGKRPVDGIRSCPKEFAVATAKPPGQF
jgi:hypothetical protein